MPLNTVSVSIASNKPNVRLVFVQMLFALAVGQLALKLGDLVVGSSIKTDSLSYYQNTLIQYPYVFTHLLLSIIIITTSWIGWQASKSSNYSQLSAAIFSFEYVVLLTDIFLVICYFIIVRGTEISSTQGMIDKGTLRLIYPVLEPNCFIETFWSMIIFIVYFIWDVVTKYFSAEFQLEDSGSNFFRKYRASISRGAIMRILPTLVCCIFSIIIFLVCCHDSNYGTALVDLILICLFLTFRGWKQILDKTYVLKEEHLSSNTIRDFKIKYPDQIFPLSISDHSYNFKWVIIKFLPLTFMIILLVVYLYKY